MALGTLVAAPVAYSTAGATTVSPGYPSGILTTDAVLLFVGQKPSTANNGTVTTPSGWTLREELTGAGGYSTTLGIDTGNTNLRIYSWDAPVANQSGTLSVTLGTNDVSWAFIVRVPTGGGTLSYGTADGQQTSAPGTSMSIALTDGATATAFKSGDLAIWAMCIPTDVSTPAQFSAHSITASGATFATAVEINEPDSAAGNDIGGFSARALVTAGTSSTAPTVTVTVGGTRTNVRGPLALVRIRETPLPSAGDLNATETGSDVFAATGAVYNVRGSLSASEIGNDAFSAVGILSLNLEELDKYGSLEKIPYSLDNVFYQDKVCGYYITVPPSENIICGYTADASITASAQITADPLRVLGGQAEVNGNASVTSNGVRLANANAEINGAAAVNALGSLIQNANAEITGNATVDGNAITLRNGFAEITCSANVATNGFAIRSAEGAINGSASLSSDSTRVRYADGAINATASVQSDSTRVALANAQVNGSASLEALGGLTVQGFVEINANGNVAAQGNLIAGAYVEINGAANITAIGFKFGEEWTVDPAEDNTWTPQEAGSNTWTTQNPGSDNWTPVNIGDNTWTEQSSGNEQWQLRG